MLSRSEDKTLQKSNRKRKIDLIFLRFVNLIFKTYAFLVSIYLVALVLVNIMYKAYLQLEPPFNYHLFIHDENELIELLSIIIISIVMSSLIAILTRTRSRVRKQEKDTAEKENKVHRRRRHRKTA